ncbi:MAG: hypothetical protein WDN50_13275 [Bradyrhizobium sp.]
MNGVSDRRVYRHEGIAPSQKQESDMTVVNDDVCELTVEQLEVASGGRIKLPIPEAVKAREIAEIERDNPGF